MPASPSAPRPGRTDALLRLLHDGRFHSGEALARELGVSRAAVWKMVAGLRQQEHAIDAVRGRGYRLRSATELLDAALIAAEVASAIGCDADVQVIDSVDSTNTALRERRDGAPPRVLFAERQTAGRGRLGRSWASPRGGGLYCSIDWHYQHLSGGPSGLSLAVGVRLAEMLTAQGMADVGVKWPNDVLWRGAKLGGILLELVGEPTGPCRVIVGVGVNWRLEPDIRAAVGQPAAALSQALPKPLPSRNRMAGLIAAAAIDACRVFPEQRGDLLAERWRRFDLLYGRDVVLELPGGKVYGRMIGVDTIGALLLATREGTERFLSGDLRVRLAP